jgi:hypothetical protein
VPERLVHVRDFVWRGGALCFQAGDGVVRTVGYSLSAEWDAAVLDPVASNAPGIQPASAALVDGRWVRRTAGYHLRVGIDLAVPSAIAIRSDRLLSSVPFLNRPADEVEHALAADLAAYVAWFLDACQPVPVAGEAAARRLHELQL